MDTNKNSVPLQVTAVGLRKTSVTVIYDTCCCAVEIWGMQSGWLTVIWLWVFEMTAAFFLCISYI